MEIFPFIQFEITNHFFLINYELKTPSVEMACLLGIQNKTQAVCFETFMGYEKANCIRESTRHKRTKRKPNLYFLEQLNLTTVE